jgi:hypothetical protein
MTGQCNTHLYERLRSPSGQSQLNDYTIRQPLKGFHEICYWEMLLQFVESC